MQSVVSYLRDLLFLGDPVLQGALVRNKVAYEEVMEALESKKDRRVKSIPVLIERRVQKKESSKHSVG